MLYDMLINQAFVYLVGISIHNYFWREAAESDEGASDNADNERHVNGDSDETKLVPKHRILNVETRESHTTALDPWPLLAPNPRSQYGYTHGVESNDESLNDEQKRSRQYQMGGK